MSREAGAVRGTRSKEPFRWRSHEVTRIEGLSDAVFAFAVTLLVVSLEVPNTFQELWQSMRGFGAFAISFAMLFQLWAIQYTFFRRYALQDRMTIFLNAILLFLVLFYVYPLKFLSTFLLTLWTGGELAVKTAEGMRPMIENSELGRLMIIYGLGMAAIFGLFGLLYVHALHRGEELALTPPERLETKISAYENFSNMMVGLISVIIVVIGGPGYSGIAGLSYFLIVVFRFGITAIRKRMERRVAPVPAV